MRRAFCIVRAVLLLTTLSGIRLAVTVALNPKRKRHMSAMPTCTRTSRSRGFCGRRISGVIAATATLPTSRIPARNNFRVACRSSTICVNAMKIHKVIVLQNPLGFTTNPQCSAPTYCPQPTFYLRSTVDTALLIYRQLQQTSLVRKRSRNSTAPLSRTRTPQNHQMHQCLAKPVVRPGLCEIHPSPCQS